MVVELLICLGIPRSLASSPVPSPHAGNNSTFGKHESIAQMLKMFEKHAVIKGSASCCRPLNFWCLFSLVRFVASIFEVPGVSFWHPRGPLRHHFAAPGLPLGPLGSFLAVGSNFDSIARTNSNPFWRTLLAPKISKGATNLKKERIQ